MVLCVSGGHPFTKTQLTSTGVTILNLIVKVLVPADNPILPYLTLVSQAARCAESPRRTRAGKLGLPKSYRGKTSGGATATLGLRVLQLNIGFRKNKVSTLLV